MEWARRHAVGFTMNTAPANELHAATEDGHTLVVLLQDDRFRGGGRGIVVRLYGQDPSEARAGEPVAPRRLPTLEEMREAVDQVAPIGSCWLLGMGMTVFRANKDASYPLASVWTEGPLLNEVPAAPAASPIIAAPSNANGDAHGRPSRLPR